MLDKIATAALWRWARGQATAVKPAAPTLLGGTEDWNRFGVRDPSLLSDPEGDPIVAGDGTCTLYFNGRNRPIDQGGTTRIGRAVGTVATGWRPDRNPVFCDGAYAAQGSVLRLGDGEHRLYYSPGTAIGLAAAVSADGIVWSRLDQDVLVRPSQFGAELIGLPYVSRQDGVWVMLFEGFAGGHARLYMALSADGMHWEPANAGHPIYVAGEAAWDCRGQANPSLVRLFPGLGAPNFAIVYNGEKDPNTWDVGVLFSDSIHGPWEPLPAPLLTRGPAGSWDSCRLEGGRLIGGTETGLGMVFFGLPSTDSYADGQIGLATLAPSDRRNRERNAIAEERYNDLLSERYFSIWDTFPMSRFMNQVESGWLRRLVPDEARVLVLGSGAGRELPALLDKRCKITCVDISQAMLDRGRERFADPTVRWVKADLHELPRFAEKFDVAVMLGGVFNYLVEPVDCLRNVRERLAADGVLIVGAMNLEHPSEGRPVYEMSDGRVRKVYRAGELAAMTGEAGFRLVEQKGIRYLVDLLPPDWLRDPASEKAKHLVAQTLALEGQLIDELPPERAKFVWTVVRAP